VGQHFLFVHKELNLTGHRHPVQPIKVNIIQTVEISRDVSLMLCDKIAKYVQNVHRGVVTIAILHELS
jgi:hypothetical protein